MGLVLAGLPNGLDDSLHSHSVEVMSRDSFTKLVSGFDSKRLGSTFGGVYWHFNPGAPIAFVPVPVSVGNATLLSLLALSKVPLVIRSSFTKFKTGPKVVVGSTLPAVISPAAFFVAPDILVLDHSASSVVSFGGDLNLVTSGSDHFLLCSPHGHCWRLPFARV